MVQKKRKKQVVTGKEEGKYISSCSSPAVRLNLEALLSPVDLGTFRARHLEREPLHVARPSCPGYYGLLSDLSTPDRLFDLMRLGTVPLYRINMFRCTDGRNKETPPPPQSVDEVVRLFNEGWSIQWLQPQHEHDGLSVLVASLETCFGCLVGVNMYLTPPDSQGLAPHWDDVDVFVLQLGGSKRWSLHRGRTDSPLTPEQQTLPRFSSGDLDPQSLSEACMSPILEPGDLLYFPRGVIHHAPNKAASPSVHLTVSTFQRQTLYDLLHKTFEEAMSELWEEDEELRRALPWSALTLKPPQLSSAVAKQLRRLADAVEAEAEQNVSGPVAAALNEMSADFVRHRMPPPAPEEEVRIVGLRHKLKMDASAIALLPVPGDIDEGAARLIHCASNARSNHMMNHPPREGDLEEGEEEELEKDEVTDPGQVLSGAVAKALRHIVSSEHKTVQELLEEVQLPRDAWQEVCQLLTQLVALGLGHVQEAEELRQPGPKKPRK